MNSSKGFKAISEYDVSEIYKHVFSISQAVNRWSNHLQIDASNISIQFIHSKEKYETHVYSFYWVCNKASFKSEMLSLRNKDNTWGPPSRKIFNLCTKV